MPELVQTLHPVTQHVPRAHVLGCARDQNGDYGSVRERSDHYRRKVGRRGGSARGDPACVSRTCLRVFGARPRRAFYFCERSCQPCTERCHRGFCNGLCSSCPATLAMDQRVPCVCGVARDYVGARSGPLDCWLGIRSQCCGLRTLLLHRRTVFHGIRVTMAKASAIRARLPHCRTTSSRSSSASGACRRLASAKRAASAASAGIAA
jgi:hypothetical protein